MARIGDVLTALQAASTTEQRADAYYNLNLLLRSESQTESVDDFLLQNFAQFAAVMLADLRSTASEVLQSDLRALGYFVHHPALAAEFSAAQIHTLISFLCDRIVTGTNKAEVSLCVWMIAVQNLAPGRVVPHAKRLLETLHVAANNSMRSSAIEFEALNAAGKLAQQLDAEFRSLAAEWAAIVFPKLLGTSAKCRDKADEIIRSAWKGLVPPTEPLQSWLHKFVDKSVQESLLEMASGSQPFHAVRVFGYLAAGLGAQLEKGGLINALLKIPSKTFSSPDLKVRQASFKSWSYLIENLALTDKLNRKRVQLLLKPISVCLAQEQSTLVREACLQTWCVLAGHAGRVAADAQELLLAKEVIGPLLAERDVGVRGLALQGALHGAAALPVRFAPLLAQLLLAADLPSREDDILAWMQQQPRLQAAGRLLLHGGDGPSTAAAPDELSPVLRALADSSVPAVQFWVRCVAERGPAESAAALLSVLVHCCPPRTALSAVAEPLSPLLARICRGHAGFAVLARALEAMESVEGAVEWHALLWVAMAHQCSALITATGALSSDADPFSTDLSDTLLVLVYPFARKLFVESDEAGVLRAWERLLRAAASTALVRKLAHALDTKLCAGLCSAAAAATAGTDAAASVSESNPLFAAVVSATHLLVSVLDIDSATQPRLLQYLLDVTQRTRPASMATQPLIALLGALATCVKHQSAAALDRALSDVVAALTPLLQSLLALQPAVRGAVSGPTPALQPAVLECWTALLNSVAARCPLPLDNTWLTRLTPALEHAFRMDAFATPTLEFWERAFGPATGLSYAPALLPVLQHLRRRAPITLPGFPFGDSPAGSQTAFSQGNLDAPEPPQHRAGKPAQAEPAPSAAPQGPSSFLQFSSPVRGAASLGAVAAAAASAVAAATPSPPGKPSPPGRDPPITQSSPRTQVSPRGLSPPAAIPLSPFKRAQALVAAARSPAGPAGRSPPAAKAGGGAGSSTTPAKRRLDLDRDDTSDYVVISTPNKGRVPLTEHQRETASKRTNLMTYTSLDPSQSQEPDYDLSQSQAASQMSRGAFVTAGGAGGVASAMTSFQAAAFVAPGMTAPMRMPCAPIGLPPHMSAGAAPLAPATSASAPAPPPAAATASDASAQFVAPPPLHRTASAVLSDPRPASPSSLPGSQSSQTQPSVRPILRTVGSPPSAGKSVRFAAEVELGPAGGGEAPAAERSVPQFTPTLPLLRIPQPVELKREDTEPSVPLFEPLVNCTDPIDAVLAAFLRANKGLRQVLAAQCIATVGALAALPARIVRLLPLPGDPVATVLRLLQEYAARLGLAVPSSNGGSGGGSSSSGDSGCGGGGESAVIGSTESGAAAAAAPMDCLPAGCGPERSEPDRAGAAPDSIDLEGTPRGGSAAASVPSAPTDAGMPAPEPMELTPLAGEAGPPVLPVAETSNLSLDSAGRSNGNVALDVLRRIAADPAQVLQSEQEREEARRLLAMLQSRLRG